MASGRTAAMRFILLTVLIDMVSIGLIVPVLPEWVGQFTSDRTQQAFWYGALMFCFGVANFFCAPILGALSDRFGRRPVLLLGFCGFAFSFFMTALVTQLWMLLAVRLVSGALQANAGVANAYVADITAPADRARRFGLLGAMFGLGFVLGPVVGGLLGSIDLRYPFWAAGTLALLNLAYGYFVLPESLPVARRQRLSWRQVNPLRALHKLTQLRGIGPLVAVIGLAAFAQFTLHTVWVMYTGLRFGWGPRENGWSLCAVGVVSVLVQGGLLRRMLAHFGPVRLAAYGLVSSTLAYALWALATQGWMMYAVIGMNIFGYTVTASIQSLVSNAADDSTQGQTLGAVTALNSLAAAIAPVVGAPLFGVVAHLPAGDWRVGAPFFFCAVLMGMATAFALMHFSKPSRGDTVPQPT